jgi:hypothetical protein
MPKPYSEDIRSRVAEAVAAGNTVRAVSRQIQPPDAENRISGGVAEVTGAIPSPRADRYSKQRATL